MDLKILMVAACCVLSACASQLDYVCSGRHDGILVPHPADCASFIECFHHVAYVKTCSANLHFNAKKGLCDYPEEAGCGSKGNYAEPKESYAPKEPAYDSYKPQRYDRYDRREPEYNSYKPEPAPAYRPEPNYYKPEDSYSSSNRPSYEETVFGNDFGGYGAQRPPYRQQPHDGYYNSYDSYGSPDNYGSGSGYNRVSSGHGDDSVENEALAMVRSRMKRHSAYARKMKSVIDSFAFRYVSNFLNAKPYSKYLGMSAMYMLQCQKLIQKRFHLGRSELKSYLTRSIQTSYLKPLPGVAVPDTPMEKDAEMDYCPYPRKWACDASSPYRTLDGACNNLYDPILGRSLTPFRRLLPANYGDGLESMRKSVTGGPLPGARDVSINLFPDRDDASQVHTLMLMNFGQFLDHDLTHAAITKLSMEDGTDFKAEMMTEVKCGNDGCETGTMETESCWPIPVPDDDSDFRYNRCIKFVRSQEVPALSCDFAPREQVNQVTAWLDASAVYGSTIEEATKLRDPDTRRGRLLVAPHPHGAAWKPMLPANHEEKMCKDANRTHACFSAGDNRVNEQAGLSTIHIQFVREHNRLEENLHLINPHWDGEKLYQETRKIVAAVMQQVVYNEWLPIVLGHDAMRQYGLYLRQEGYDFNYDSSVDPRMPNSFGAAAFRFGHTLIHESVRRADANLKYDDSLMLSDLFFKPKHLYDTDKGGVDGFVRGMCEAARQNYDPFFTKQVSRSLFTENPPHGLGMDLLSLNIQRARDHGIPSYNDFRELCGLRRARYFTDLQYEVTNEDALYMLSKVYESPDDIDLFAGGISEASVPGGVVGPTFACIIGKTFRDIKDGDRFWFERKGKQGFTPAQLAEIRKATLSKLMCDNSDKVDEIQPWVLFMVTEAPDNAQEMLTKLADLDQHELWFQTLAYAQGRSSGVPESFRHLLRNDPDILHEMFPTNSRGVPPNFRVPCELLPTIDLSAWRESY